MNQYKPTVCILLSTYNGSLHIDEQLASIEAQTYLDWFVIVSDDGSKDNTLEIVANYQDKWESSKIKVISGPMGGFCKNFLTLATKPDIQADLYAFCDQDDVWKPEKLQHIIQSLNWEQYTEKPFLYCGRTEIVDHRLNPIGLSPNFKRQPSFQNALVQSIAGGNTMVFNHATKSMLMTAAVTSAVSHDWWLYQLVTGCGGTVYYDPVPLIKYRQHEDSLIGANISYQSQLKRMFQAFNNRFRNWNDINALALNQSKALLTPENQEILSLFNQLRETNSPIKRLWLLFSAGLYRQSLIDTYKLWIACALNKI